MQFLTLEIIVLSVIAAVVLIAILLYDSLSDWR